MVRLIYWNEILANEYDELGTTCKHGGVWNCADRYNPGYVVCFSDSFKAPFTIYNVEYLS